MTQVEEHEALVEACAKAARIEMAGDPERSYSIARAALAVIAEKAKEWPTEGMKKSYWASDVNAWRAMFSASPLVKPEENPK